MMHHSVQPLSDFHALAINNAAARANSSEPFASHSMSSAWASITDENHKVREAEPLQSIVAGLEQPHYGGDGDNILVSFSRAAPMGWVLHLNCNNPTVQLPNAYSVPQGAYNVFVPFVSETVREITEVSISVSLCGQTITAPLAIVPREK